MPGFGRSLIKCIMPHKNNTYPSGQALTHSRFELTTSRTYASRCTAIQFHLFSFQCSQLRQCSSAQPPNQPGSRKFSPDHEAHHLPVRSQMPKSGVQITGRGSTVITSELTPRSYTKDPTQFLPALERNTVRKAPQQDYAVDTCFIPPRHTGPPVSLGLQGPHYANGSIHPTPVTGLPALCVLDMFLGAFL